MIKRKRSKVNTPKSNHSPTVTYIVESTSIKADISCENDIRILGSIEGNLDSSGKVILGKSGKLNGEILAPDIDIAGHVEGNIYAREKLLLRASAVVEGEIKGKKVTVENGARVTGKLQIGAKVDVNKKKNNPAAQAK